MGFNRQMKVLAEARRIKQGAFKESTRHTDTSGVSFFNFMFEVGDKVVLRSDLKASTESGEVEVLPKGTEWEIYVDEAVGKGKNHLIREIGLDDEIRIVDSGELKRNLAGKSIKESTVRQDQVDWYIQKFKDKMRGSSFDTGKGWVDAIGHLSQEEKDLIWNAVKWHCNTVLQNRLFEESTNPLDFSYQVRYKKDHEPRGGAKTMDDLYSSWRDETIDASYIEKLVGKAEMEKMFAGGIAFGDYAQYRAIPRKRVTEARKAKKEGSIIKNFRGEVGIACGFAIITTDGEVLEQNLVELAEEGSYGFTVEDVEAYLKPDQVVDDYLRIESNVLAQLKKVLVWIRDEGHGSRGDLIGSCTVPLSLAEDAYQARKEEDSVGWWGGGNGYWPEGIDENAFYEGVSEFGKQGIDVHVHFFDWPENRDGEPWNPFEEGLDSVEVITESRRPRKSKTESTSTGHAQLDAFLSEFPDDAQNWGQATDEIRDTARWAREFYTEIDLDGSPDDWEKNKEIPQPLNFRSFKTPSEWNTQAKKYIVDIWNKMSEQAREKLIDRLGEWLESSFEESVSAEVENESSDGFTVTLFFDTADEANKAIPVLLSAGWDVTQSDADLWVEGVQASSGQDAEQKVMSVLAETGKYVWEGPGDRATLSRKESRHRNSRRK